VVSIKDGMQGGKMRIYEAATGHVLVPKRDSASHEGSVSGDEPLNMAENLSSGGQGPSRRGLSLADADDDSVMNMPVVLRSLVPRRKESPYKRQKNRKTKDELDEPRRGFITRLTSRRKIGTMTSGEPDAGHRRMTRMLELVSVGRANVRVMAAGPSEQSRRRDIRHEDESDESSSGPSPPASTRHRVESPEMGFDEQRSSTPSSDGLKDILCYCLCIPRCH